MLLKAKITLAFGLSRFPVPQVLLDHRGRDEASHCLWSWLFLSRHLEISQRSARSLIGASFARGAEVEEIGRVRGGCQRQEQGLRKDDCLCRYYREDKSATFIAMLRGGAGSDAVQPNMPLLCGCGTPPPSPSPLLYHREC